MNFIRRHKLWILFATLLTAFVVVALYYSDEHWMNSFLQIGALILTVIYTQTLTIENSKEVNANTERQIKAISENTEREIKSTNENTDRQIRELQRLTSEQIETLKQSTDKQIEHYRKETERLVEQLKNNSELLAGILQRHLEDAINDTQKELNSANYQYRNIQSFKIGRTADEKKVQLQNQTNFIHRVGQKLEYFKTQYQKLLDFIRGQNHEHHS